MYAHIHTHICICVYVLLNILLMLLTMWRIIQHVHVAITHSNTEIPTYCASRRANLLCFTDSTLPGSVRDGSQGGNKQKCPV